MARQLAASASRRFLLYAPGSGRGHATRMGALAAELCGLGHEILALLPGEAQQVARAVGAPAECLTALPSSEPERALDQAMREFAPSDLVVDTFPEGRGGTLDPRRWPHVRAVALLRYRRDVESAVVQNAVARYAAAFDLEPELGWAGRGLSPFGAVVRRLGELPAAAPASLKDRVLLIASERRHAAFLERLGERLRHKGVATRLVAAGRLTAPLLTAEALAGRVVVGPAGYNLTYELLALGCWHLALPAARQYDDQRLRASRVASVVHAPEAAERRVLAWLAGHSPRPRGSVRQMWELARELVTARSAPG